MNTDERENLRRLAEAMLPCEPDDGCLECAERHCFARVGPSGAEDYLDCNCRRVGHGEFIAAVSPEVVLGLLDENQEQKREIAHRRESEFGYAKKLEAAEAEVERLKETLDAYRKGDIGENKWR